MKRTAFWKADWFLGLLVALVLFFASRSDLVQSLERLVYDWDVRASSHAPSTRVVVTAIDDQSIANIGRWPWSRDIQAHMIGKLRQGGAKVAGCASFFFEPPIDILGVNPALPEWVVEIINKGARQECGAALFRVVRSLRRPCARAQLGSIPWTLLSSGCPT